MSIFFSQLLKRADFIRVWKVGRYCSTQNLIVQACALEEINEANSKKIHQIRVGFTATKKIGGAVARNRAKRRMRALVRLVLPLYQLHREWSKIDLVLIAKKSLLSASFAVLIEDFKLALNRLGFLPS